ncbi:hypothetical protein ASZ90_006858 [hydrocarbon metagenome]|uniref:Uncharacterized protein n=1 Tax=hydrocarbon metagenome TaxID=938273 RepID=A0A0W8FR11_9ZZZZ
MIYIKIIITIIIIITALWGMDILFRKLYAFYCKHLLEKTYSALEAKNLKDAMKYAKRIIKTPLKAQGYEVLAEISQIKGDHMSAIDYFTSSLKHDSTFKLSLLGLSESYKEVGRLNDAIKMLDKAAELYPYDVMVLHCRNELKQE